ncbi:ATP12 family chaperone protein [Bartonella apis]|uniref:ATP12 family chaperone protein n=1 Tax=Bartonella apis TaxID=1686310 RepID=UPI0009683525|nr:ATP12 family protein [Bartonella apis]OLY47338.1 Chaperone required for the assembly of the F1-ATPase [Bartonella apis]
MREFLQELNDDAEKADPVKQAQLLSKRELPKRFYKEAFVKEVGGEFAVVLDGKTVKTPARHKLVLPNRALAEIVAHEFNSQRQTIDPAKMPVTRLVNSILDGVVDNMDVVRHDILEFVGNDMLFYRADSPKELVERQHHHWDPILEWIRKDYGARFMLTEGVMFVKQPDDSISAIGEALEAIESPYVLAALHSITTLCGSALLALAVWKGKISLPEAWKLAHLDEDWTIEHWGEDAEAKEKRAYHRAEYEAAAATIAAIENR